MRYLALLTIAVCGCGAPKGDGRLEVVCTTGMIADLARNVGGDRVSVTQLMGEGVDPHLYKPSTGDVAKLEAAGLILFNGLHLEGKMGELFTRLARRKPAVAVAERLDRTSLLETDPHVWFDVALWRKVSDAVRDALVEHDPDGADGYRSRHGAYAAKLDELHAWAKTELAAIPEKRRVLVTAHDAFRYFGRAYGVEVRGIQGISTESEAGVSDVNALVEYLVTKKIRSVFVESSVPERNVRAIREGCAARGHEVAVGGELFSDAMGKPGTPEGTYEGMVRHNVRTIVEGLK